VLGVLAPFVTEYVLGRPDLIAVVPAVFVVAGVASIPVWILLSRRFGKRNVWLFAMGSAGLCFGCTFFVGPGQLLVLCVLLAGAGAASACGGVIGASMLADVIDYDELHSGERKEGAYSAAWGFAFKLAIGLTVAMTGVALQLSGFQPNAEQTRTAELTLRGLFAGAPLAASAISMTFLARFSLDQREHDRIRALLDERRESLRESQIAERPPHSR
jgi:GPH family glycoside/pentoside/hexuronide:cation symporter